MREKIHENFNDKEKLMFSNAERGYFTPFLVNEPLIKYLFAYKVASETICPTPYFYEMFARETAQRLTEKTKIRFHPLPILNELLKYFKSEMGEIKRIYRNLDLSKKARSSIDVLIDNAYNERIKMEEAINKINAYKLGIKISAED